MDEFNDQFDILSPVEVAELAGTADNFNVHDFYFRNHNGLESAWDFSDLNPDIDGMIADMVDNDRAWGCEEIREALDEYKKADEADELEEMTNDHTRLLSLTRREVCDLLIAIDESILRSTSDEWMKLHDKIKNQMEVQDTLEGSLQ